VICFPLMSLQPQRQELERLGFSIVAAEEGTLIGVCRKWHLDCILTRITYVVFVRYVEQLTATVIERDRVELEQRARTLDTSLLPRGFQKGVAVLTAYVAGQVDDDARALVEQKPKSRFAFFYLPGVIDASTGQVHLLRGTPMWGALYFAKFRFLMRRMLQPGAGSAHWPVSVGGSLMGALIVAIIIFNLTIIFGR
jgi:hypothetical protein